MVTFLIEMTLSVFVHFRENLQSARFVVVVSIAAVTDVDFVCDTAAVLGVTMKDNTFSCKIQKLCNQL
jgi:hypothetical protein